MKTFGEYTLSTHVHDTFRLDGGAMFGSVPKNLWQKIIAVDEENCIPLCSRSLLIKHNNRQILIEAGNGDKFPDKLKNIFNIESNPESKLGFEKENITDLILTHLHFDHAGGISYYEEQDLKLSYPNALHYVQSANYENAKNPNPREQASYLTENVAILEKAELKLLEDGEEIYPGISVHVVNGHTVGLQWIKINTGSDTIAFPSDLIPTSRHLPVPYIMGYDICAGTSLAEKTEFLSQAHAENWIIVFGHDIDTAAARIGVDKKGHYCVAENLDF